MPHVVLLRGVNVGGHRTFRPSALAASLKHLDVVSIGAAGTFVVRAPVTQARLRTEFARRLKFETEIVICPGREILALVDGDHFAAHSTEPGIVRFVSVMSKRPRIAPALPLSLPFEGDWLLRLVAHERRFILGVYRRHMKTIRYLGMLDRLLGAPVTTRNWNTVTAIAKVLGRTGESAS